MSILALSSRLSLMNNGNFVALAYPLKSLCRCRLIAEAAKTFILNRLLRVAADICDSLGHLGLAAGSIRSMLPTSHRVLAVGLRPGPAAL